MFSFAIDARRPPAYSYYPFGFFSNVRRLLGQRFGFYRPHRSWPANRYPRPLPDPARRKLKRGQAHIPLRPTPLRIAPCVPLRSGCPVVGTRSLRRPGFLVSHGRLAAQWHIYDASARRPVSDRSVRAGVPRRAGIRNRVPGLLHTCGGLSGRKCEVRLSACRPAGVSSAVAADRSALTGER